VCLRMGETTTLRRWDWRLALSLSGSVAFGLACSSSVSSPAACEGVGGGCVTVAECSPDAGHVNGTECPGYPDTVCCLPLSACATPEPVCCSGQLTFRPDCTVGQYVCVSGTFCDAG